MSLQITVMSLDFESFAGPRTQTFSKPEVSFGRLPTNDVVLETPEVSQKHACLRLKRDHATGDMKIFVTDLGSTNGTLVENSPVVSRTDVEVASNVRIRIGNYLIKPSYVDDGLDEIKFEDHLYSKNEITNGHAEAVISTFQPIEKIATNMANVDFDALIEEEDSDVDTRSTRLFRIEDLEKYSIRPNDVEADNSPHNNLKAEESLRAEEHISETEVEFPAEAVQKAAAALENQEYVGAEMESTANEVNHIETDFTETPIELEHLSPVAPEFEVVISGRTDIADFHEHNFDAIALHRLGGQVIHRGKPLAGVSIVAEGIGHATTDEDGSFVFENIEDGTPFSIEASKDRFRFDTSRSSGVLVSNTVISLDATKLVSIKGRIVHKGQPLAGVFIDAGPLGTTVTSEDGVYLFNDIPENTEYTIRASKPGFKLR